MKSNFLFYLICSILIAIIVIVVFEEPIKETNNSDTNSSFSTGLTKKGKIDLVKKLDPTYITPMVEKLYKDAFRKKVDSEKINQHVLNGLQDFLSEISLVDMNNDEQSDPIFVIPDGDGDSFHYSIRVPNWSAISGLPISSGNSYAKEMYKIASQDYIELSRISVLPKYAEEVCIGFDIQLQPNQNLYSEHKSFYLNTFGITLPDSIRPKSLCRPPVWWTDSYFWTSGGIYSRPYDPKTTRQVAAARSNYLTVNGIIPINKTSEKALSKPDGTLVQIKYENRNSDELADALANFKSMAKELSKKNQNSLAINESNLTGEKKKPQPYWSSKGRFRN